MKLTKAQITALEWLLFCAGPRKWYGTDCGDPSIAALDALWRKGLASKRGGGGAPIYYTLTDAGRIEIGKAA